MKNNIEKELKKQIKLERKLKAPWTRFYGDVPAHINYPDMMMWELVDDAAKMYPNYVALEYFGVEITYSKMMDLIHEAARSLKALGVTKDDVVTICAPNMPQSVVLFYAINMVGAIANMIHPLSAEKEIEKYLSISGSTYIFAIDISCDKILNILHNTKLKKIVVMTANDKMPKMMSAVYWLVSGRKTKIDYDRDNILSYRDFIDFGYMFEDEYMCKRNVYDPAVILYSGGTSGDPKGIVLSNLNFNALAQQSFAMCDPASEGDSVLAILPIFHGFGLGVCIHTPLCAGMSVILIPSFDPKKFAKLIKQKQPSFICAVPSLYEVLTKAKLGKKELACIKCAVAGGDFMSGALKEKIDTFLKEHGSEAEVRVGYGLTEASAATCLTPSGGYKEGSIGIPFPDTYYKIVRIGTHEECPYGEDGEICISGPTVMQGYLNNLEETIQTLRTHEDGRVWLHTGDVG